MKKTLWVTVGLGLGIIITLKAKDLLHKFTPEGASDYIEEQASAFAGSVRSQFSQFNAARKAREAELLTQLFVDSEAERTDSPQRPVPGF